LAAGGARDRRDVINDAMTAGHRHWLHCSARESPRWKAAKLVRASDDFFYRATAEQSNVERDNVTDVLSVCPSVARWYSATNNSHSTFM